MPTLQVMSVHDNPSLMRSGPRRLPTVVYVFTPSCVWCKRNLDNALNVEQAAKQKFDFISLSLTKDGLHDYVSQPSHLQNVVYLDPKEPLSGPSSIFDGTPETIVIDTDGRIVKVWYGAFTGSTKSDVEEYFKITLPGLKDVSGPGGT